MNLNILFMQQKQKKYCKMNEVDEADKNSQQQLNSLDIYHTLCFSVMEASLSLYKPFPLQLSSHSSPDTQIIVALHSFVLQLSINLIDLIEINFRSLHFAK